RGRTSGCPGLRQPRTDPRRGLRLARLSADRQADCGESRPVGVCCACDGDQLAAADVVRLTTKRGDAETRRAIARKEFSAPPRLRVPWSGKFRSLNFVGLFDPESAKLFAKIGSRVGENRNREKACVRRSGFADRGRRRGTPARAFACAPHENVDVTSGVRCADMTCFSLGTPNLSNTSTACCIVSQSDDEPMITGTRGMLTAFCD